MAVVMSPQGKATLYRGRTAMGTGQTSVPSNVLRKPNYVGKSNYGETDPPFRGDLAEVILYGRALPEAEHAYVEAYLQAKYFDPTFPPAVARPGEE